MTTKRIRNCCACALYKFIICISYRVDPEGGVRCFNHAQHVIEDFRRTKQLIEINPSGPHITSRDIVCRDIEHRNDMTRRLIYIRRRRDGGMSSPHPPKKKTRENIFRAVIRQIA